jgi:DNA-binding MarR family transcriptional regulator
MKNRFQELMTRAQEAGSKVRALSNKGMKKVEHAPRDLERKTSEVTTIGRKKWKELKSNVRHDVKGIGKTVKALFARKG